MTIMSFAWVKAVNNNSLRLAGILPSVSLGVGHLSLLIIAGLEPCQEEPLILIEGL